MTLIYFAHKNGKEYIGHIDGPSIPFTAERQRLTKARSIELLTFPVQTAQGFAMQNQVVLRPIVLSDPNIESLLFSWEDIVGGLTGTPNLQMQALYQKATSVIQQPTAEQQRAVAASRTTNQQAPRSTKNVDQEALASSELSNNSEGAQQVG